MNSTIIDSDEFTSCSVCGEPTDCYDDYGRQTHGTKTYYNLLPDIISNLSPQCYVRLENRGNEHNIKCFLIKELNQKISETQEKLRLITAILNGEITFDPHSSMSSLMTQIENIGLKNRVLYNVNICHLTQDTIENLTNCIEIHRADIALLKQLRSL